MSWSDFFPVLDDALVDRYLGLKASEKSKYQEHFAVDSIFNRKSSQHIVATSLFWKPAHIEFGDFPVLSRELLQNPGKHIGGSRNCHPWLDYVKPLLDGAIKLQKLRPDVSLRIYLAKDLEFLVTDFVDLGCEVFLMKSSSIRHNPGAMWRFLAMEEASLVTITDSDRARSVIHDIKRTELVRKAGLKYWRVPYFLAHEEPEFGSPGNYRTAWACQFGSASPLPTRLLMEACVWGSTNGLLSTNCRVAMRDIPCFGSTWPTYGYDEWFLNVAVFPRIAFEGVHTLVGYRDKALNKWFALDIEYCTWANSKSEILLFDDSNPNKSADSTLLQNKRQD